MKKGEITRQRILELAAPLFNEHGYEGCSMAAIMAATGLEKGGLYRYFASKQELAIASLEYAFETTRRARMEGLDELPSALARVQQMIQRFGSPIAGGCPFLNAAVDADDGNEGIRSLARQAFETWRLDLGKLLRKAHRDGELAATTQPALLADTIIAALEGALVISRVQGNRTALRNVQTTLLAMLQPA